jgi:hypothetical protein
MTFLYLYTMFFVHIHSPTTLLIVKFRHKKQNFQKRKKTQKMSRKNSHDLLFLEGQGALKMGK